MPWSRRQLLSPGRADMQLEHVGTRLPSSLRFWLQPSVHGIGCPDHAGKCLLYMQLAAAGLFSHC